MEVFAKAGVIERLWPDFFEQRMASRILSCPDDDAKAPGVVKAQLTIAFEVPDDMVVATELLSFLDNPEAAAHPQVNEKCLGAGVDEEVLSSPGDGAKMPPPQPPGEVSGNRLAEPIMAHFDPLDPTFPDQGLDPPTGRFDLRQLRHFASFLKFPKIH